MLCINGILFIWFCKNELEYNNDSVNASRHVGHDRQLKHLPIIEMSETGHQARLQVPTMPDCARLCPTEARLYCTPLCPTNENK